MGVLTINSDDLINGQFKIPRPIYAKSISVTSIKFTKSYYPITAFNNVISWVRASNPFSFTITPGKYSISQLLAELETGMDAADVGNTHTWTFSTITLKTTLSVVSTIELVFSRFLEIVGHQTDDGTTFTVRTSALVFNINPFTSLYWTSTELNNSAENITSNGVPNLIATAHVGDSDTVIVYYERFTYKYTRVDPLVHLTFEVYNKDRQIVDFNGVPWEMVLSW